MRSAGFLNLAAFQASGAHADMFRGAAYKSMDALEVKVPTALGHIMRVGDSMAEAWPTAANIAYF